MVLRKDTLVMSRGVLAASLVLVWLALSGLEHLSDIKVSDYCHAQRTAKADLATPGETNADDDLRLLPSQIESSRPCYPTVFLSLPWFRKEIVYSKEDSKIYKLHGVLLI